MEYVPGAAVDAEAILVGEDMRLQNEDHLAPLRMIVDQITDRTPRRGSAWNMGDLEAEWALYRFTDSSYVTNALSNPEESLEMLGLMDRLVCLQPSLAPGSETVDKVRWYTTGLVFKHIEAVTAFAIGDGERAEVAQRLIYLTMCERDIFPYGGESLFNAMCAHLPRMAAISQEFIPYKKSDEQTKRLVTTLLVQSGTARAGEVLDAVAQVAADPETQSLGEAMLKQIVARVGGTAPESTAELAYRIQVSNMVRELDLLYPKSKDKQQTLLADLDSAGRALGLNKHLWDAVTTFLAETRYGDWPLADFATEAALKHYQLDYNMLLKSWEASSGFDRDSARFRHYCRQNLQRILALERLHAGSAKVLVDTFKIHSFNRIPLEGLRTQYEAICSKGTPRYGLVGIGRQENRLENSMPGALSAEVLKPRLSSLIMQAKAMGITLFFYEGDGVDFLSALAKAPTKASHGRPAAFAVGFMHGNGRGMYPGVSDDPRGTIRQQDINRLGRPDKHRFFARWLANTFEPGADIGLYCCKAGTAGAHGDEMADLFDRTVVTSVESTRTSSITLVQSEEGGVRLEIEYEIGPTRRIMPRC